MGKTIIKTLHVDPESTFGTVASGAYSAYVSVPAEGVEFSPTQAFVDREVQTEQLGVHVAGLVGPKGGKVKFKTGVPGLATAGASSVLAVAHPWLDELLTACALVKNADTGGVVTGSSSTTTSVVMTSSSGISVGALVMINGEVRIVTANAANTLTVSPALTSAPAAADVVYAGATFHTSDTGASVTLVGVGDGYVYRFKGCSGKVALSDTDAQKRPMLAWEFDVADWDTTTPTGTAPSRSLANHIPSVIASPLKWGTTLTPSAGFTFSDGRNLAPKNAGEAVNGICGWVVTDEKPVASFKPYYASAYATDFAAGTARALLLQIGAVPNKAMAVYAHQAQITDGWQPGDVGGVVGHDVKVKILDTGVAALAYPYAIGFF